jgi:hypothetical protein
MGKDTQRDISDDQVEKDKIQTNLNQIRTMAKDGKSVEEISKTLDLKDVGLLKNALIQLMAEEGEKLNIVGLDRASIRPTYTAGGIRIDPAMLEDTGFRPGDEFEVKVTEDGITLKKRGPL